MSLKFFQGRPELDHRLTPWAWLNTSSQTHVFNSYLEKAYPLRVDPKPRLECPPGKLLFLDHDLYTIHTRDDSPATGSRMTRNEAVENFPPSIYTTGVGVVSKHEKKI